MNNQTIHNLNESMLKQQYDQFILDRISMFSKIVAPLGILIISFYTYQDHQRKIFYDSMYYFRIIPIIASGILFVFVYSRLIKYKITIRNLYFCVVISILAMGTSIMPMLRVYDEKFLTGYVVVIFVVYAGSFYGIKVLLPLYIVSISTKVVVLIAANKIPPDRIVAFMNPAMLAVACTVLAAVNEKLRFDDFVKNIIIKNKNDDFNLEMNLAKSIQNSLRPMKCPLMPEFTLHTIYKPMIQLGGDFYDYIQFKEPNKLGIFICDVSGHGVSAALVASMVKTLINTSGASKLKPAEFLHYINNKLIDQTSGHFVTAFYGIYDSDTKKLEYARGGHTFPYIVRDDKIIKLQSRGPLLALFNNIYIEQSEVQLKPNDKVLLYTDGLTEAKNSAGLMFESRLERHLLKIRHLEIDEYVENIYKTLVEFIGSEEIDDDVCMIGIRVG